MKISTINNSIPAFKATIENAKLISPYVEKKEFTDFIEHISKLGTEKDIVDFQELQKIPRTSMAILTVNLKIKEQTNVDTSIIHILPPNSNYKAIALASAKRKISSAFETAYKADFLKNTKNKIKSDQNSNVIAEQELKTLPQKKISEEKNATTIGIQSKNNKIMAKEQEPKPNVVVRENKNDVKLETEQVQQNKENEKLNNKNTNPFVKEKQTPNNTTEIEALINKKIEEKLNAIQKTQEKQLTKNDIENLIEKKLTEKLKSDKQFQRELKEIIKDSPDEITKAITNYAKAKYNEQNYSTEFRIELNRYLKLLGPNYQG